MDTRSNGQKVKLIKTIGHSFDLLSFVLEVSEVFLVVSEVLRWASEAYGGGLRKALGVLRGISRGTRKFQGVPVLFKTVSGTFQSVP